MDGRSILAGWGGSRAGGFYHSPEMKNGFDDQDVLGVRIGQIEDYLGVRVKVPTPALIAMNDFQSTSFELKDFIHRLVQGEPRAFILLYAPLNHTFYISNEGAILRENRDLFLSRMIYQGFVTFAKECFRKMQEVPTSGGWMGMRRMGAYSKLGFDPTWAAKGLYTLQLGVEILETRNVWPDRTRAPKKDAELYHKIKDQGWNITQVLVMGEYLSNSINKAVVDSPLPDEPDLGRVEDITTDILSHYLAMEVSERRREVAFPNLRKRLEENKVLKIGPKEETHEPPDPTG